MTLAAIPIALRVVYRDRFVRGPFHLGSFSYPVAVAAVAWIAFIAIAFILPQANVRIHLISLGSLNNIIDSSNVLAGGFADVELFDCGCWNCDILQCRILVDQRQKMVHRSCQANCWCVLYPSVLWMCGKLTYS